MCHRTYLDKRVVLDVEGRNTDPPCVDSSDMRLGGIGSECRRLAYRSAGRWGRADPDVVQKGPDHSNPS